MLVSLVAEVEDAVAHGDPARRVETLRRMTDLFIEQAPHLADLHVAVFDEVILRLARGIEFRVRVELSERLADVANAPRHVLRDLAFDDEIAVARPVLERASRLDDDDLARVACEKGPEHLLALSRRASISARITDILVDRGDARVVEAVCRNDGAALSDRSLDRLMERARGDAELQRRLAARAGLAREQMSQLVAIAREKARAALGAALGPGCAEAASAALEEAAADVERTSSYKALVDDFAEAAAIVAGCADEGRLTEEQIAAWAREDRIDEALAAMARLAQVPTPVVARAFHSSHYDPLLFVARSLKFGWGTFKTLLVAKAGRELSEEMQRSAFAAFQQLSVGTAQRIVRFTAARERALEAEPL